MSKLSDEEWKRIEEDTIIVEKGTKLLEEDKRGKLQADS